MNTLQNWFLNLAGRGERYLFGLTLAALGLLAISQLLMANGKVRYYMNRVEFLEGEPYPVPSLAEEEDCWVELALEGREEPLEVLVNGEVYGSLGPQGI
nr:hypothetical protein [Bacillota bacterium]